ncbi:MAG: hypothetical protein JO227_09500 [Acetobacteraceae bacterium]|nr:hypothetical protein [Acetobacteraceae bacterium]
MLVSGSARGQSGTLQLPAHKAAEAPPKAPAAAPVTPVQQVKPSPPPVVVAPHGSAHAQKPATAKQAPKKAAAAKTPPPKPPEAAKSPEPAPPPSSATAKFAEPEKGSVTGMPLPRFASLRSDDVNLRAGPGTRYPIDWVYKRRDLPVEIEREFEVWRLVRDPDGTRGWVHQATLTGRRSFIIEGEDTTLRNAPQDSATPVAVLKKGVVGRVRACDAGSDWCQVQVGAYRGFIKRSQFWGTTPGEAIAP